MHHDLYSIGELSTKAVQVQPQLYIEMRHIDMEHSMHLLG